MRLLSTRRRYLQTATAGLTAGIAGCSLSSDQNKENSDEYDVLLRHNYDFQPPDREQVNVQVSINVNKFTDESDIDGETVFEETLELPPEETTERFTNAFSKTDDVFEWIVSTEMKALIGDELLRVNGEVVDALDTTSSDTYRFKPDGSRAPGDNVVTITTDDDTSDENNWRVEEIEISAGEQP